MSSAMERMKKLVAELQAKVEAFEKTPAAELKKQVDGLEEITKGFDSHLHTLTLRLGLDRFENVPVTPFSPLLDIVIEVRDLLDQHRAITSLILERLNVKPVGKEVNVNGKRAVKWELEEGALPRPENIGGDDQEQKEVTVHQPDEMPPTPPEG